MDSKEKGTLRGPTTHLEWSERGRVEGSGMVEYVGLLNLSVSVGSEE